MITLFYLKSCPYCKEALRWIEELKNENPEYRDIGLKLVEESVEKEYADSFDYYFVPTFYAGGEKLHEGASTKEKIRKIFDKERSLSDALRV